jgi:hypothetical protein
MRNRTSSKLTETYFSRIYEIFRMIPWRYLSCLFVESGRRKHKRGDVDVLAAATTVTAANDGGEDTRPQARCVSLMH